MNEYLFNQNLTIVLSVLCALAGFFFVKKLRRAKFSWQLWLAQLVLAAALWAVEVSVIAKLFGLQDIPMAGYVLAAIFDVWLVLTSFQIRARSTFIVGLAATLTTLLLFCAAVNTYYQYYPTLAALFAGSYKRGGASSLTVNHQHAGYVASTLEQSLYGAGQAKGSLGPVHIPGTRSGLPARDAYVYLPPAYNESALKGVRFPVLLLLTGTPGSPSNWLHGDHFANTMNSFARHHEGITPIVVIADHSGSFTNDTECLNSSHGNADTYLTIDVPVYLKAHYRVQTDPANWGIGGFSEGGMCAAMLTLEHQDIFRHILDMGGDPMPYLNDAGQTLPVLFHGSKTAQKEHNIDWLLENKPKLPGLTAQFAIGANDNKRLISEMRTTYGLASKEKIPGSLELIAHEGHSADAWAQGYSDALPQLSYYLGATDCETVCSQ